MLNIRSYTLAFAQLFGSAVMGIAVFALLGHLFDCPSLYTWHGVGATSIPTATMNLLQAAALLFLSLTVADENRKS